MLQYSPPDHQKPLTIEEEQTYIRIFEGTSPPHFFPKYVQDILIISEISYQSNLHGINATLKREKKLPISPLIYFWNFGINTYKTYREQSKLILEFISSGLV